MTRASRDLARLLHRPDDAGAMTPDRWTDILTVARAEQLIGSLACRLADQSLPDRVRRVLDDALVGVHYSQSAARWEAEMTRRALLGGMGVPSLDIPIVLLKGAAYVIAGLSAGAGRFIGDLDILVPRGALGDVEGALLAAGWEWVKADAYDDGYYRDHMHELPPLIHRERDRMIDVHHTILPQTARVRPVTDALIADAVPLGNGLSILSPEDMICHAAAHLIADGDLQGGMRNLWDIRCLLDEFGARDTDFRARLGDRAGLHGLSPAVDRAIRLADAIYGDAPLDPRDRLFARTILSRDGIGLRAYPATRFAFYLRGHAMRMPPAMLARHLWTKWRKA